LEERLKDLLDKNANADNVLKQYGKNILFYLSLSNAKQRIN